MGSERAIFMDMVINTKNESVLLAHMTKQYANCRQTLAHAKAINRKRAAQTLATADSYSPSKKGNRFPPCFMETSRRKRTCRSPKEVPSCFVMHADALGFPYLYLLACFLLSFLLLCGGAGGGGGGRWWCG